jgi:hypothetical protein
MQQITSITNEPNQHFKLQIDQNSDVDIYLRWLDTQTAWFMDLVFGTTLSIYSKRVIISPNMLSQFSNQIPFGIMILSQYGQDPMTIDAFSTGNWQFYLMNAADVATYGATYG